MRNILFVLPVVGLASANRLAVRQSSVTSAPSPTSTGAAAPAPSTEPVTLLTQNPTAIPLASIVSSPVPEPTIPLPTVYQPGAVPTGITGAPPLPNYAGLVPANYPALDVVPPTNSPEVQAWIQKVKNSGITIPGFSPTVAGGCGSNPTIVGDASRCWWTCGQCVRPTDITTCPDKLTWGLSFDDGPSPYTPNLLSFLNEKQLKSTFFIVGSRAISRPDILAAEYMQGHQLSVHTWSHTALTTQTNEQIIAELGWTAKVIKDITGVTPNTMRPPYGDIDDRVRAIALAMGMTPIIWTSDTSGGNYDTNDWHIPAGTVSASGVINEFNRILQDATKLSTGFIVLAHDLYQQSVDLATGYVLPDALARQPPFKLQPIITCQHQPLQNAYVETNQNSTNPPPGQTGGTPTGGAQATGAAAPLRLADGSASVGITALLLGAIGFIL